MSVQNEPKIYSGAKISHVEFSAYNVIGEDSYVADSKLGQRVQIDRRNMIIGAQIGDFSYVGHNTTIKYAKIGKFCSISWNVSIGGAEHDIHHISTHPFAHISKFGFVEQTEKYSSFGLPVTIGNDVWIGSNVCILRNVSIGDGAVIGAGAVVTRDVKPYEIVAGVPAKRISQRFDEDMISQLMNLKWWDLPYETIKEHIDVFKEDLTSEKLAQIKDLFCK